jgi:hypothetical protein
MATQLPEKSSPLDGKGVLPHHRAKAMSTLTVTAKGQITLKQIKEITERAWAGER